jgi:nitrite reductase/ring-hydroxylating ferredoxin subunit
MSPPGRDREGIEQAATILIATGLVSLPVAVLPGAVDWSLLPPERQRLGLVHLGANAFAAACMGASLVARSRGRRGCGLGWSFGGVALAGAGAAIGSHLRHRFVAGPGPADHHAADHHAAVVSHPAAGEWTEIGPLDALPQRRPQVQSIGDRRVVVVRRGDEVNVLADTCSHQSGPLSDGMISEHGGRDRVVCPWHGSTFDLGSGQVVHGPATAPQPVFDVRVVDGIVSARAGEPRAGSAHRRAGARRAAWAFTVPWK